MNIDHMFCVMCWLVGDGSDVEKYKILLETWLIRKKWCQWLVN